MKGYEGHVNNLQAVITTHMSQGNPLNHTFEEKVKELKALVLSANLGDQF
jgi:hypothetical protein